MSLLMFRILRARTRITAVAVSAALCTMLFATCLTAAEMPAKDLACCAAMQHDCDGMSMESSCCVAPSTPQHAVVSSKPTQDPGPASIPATLPAMGSLAVEPQVRLKPEISATSPPGVPTYLFVSTFRI
jgi:hypothetical protein